MKNDNTMIRLSFLLLLPLAGFFAACNNASGENELDNNNLESLRAMKSEKERALHDLQGEIRELDLRIAQIDTTANGSRKRLVTTGTPEKRDFAHYTRVQGSVQAGDAVYASSETGGRMIARYVDEGQQVRRGQLVAEVDLESLKKQIAEVQTSLDLAKDVYQRQKRLWDQKIGSEMQYLQAKNNKERLEKSLETLQVNLKKGRVYAPIAGIVNKTFLEPGEMAAPGAPVAEILATSRVKVVADVPENYLTKIKRGDPVQVSFPALSKKETARVTLIGASIDPSNRTFKLEIALDNPTGTLKPNLLADIEFVDYFVKNAIVIPIELVQQDVSGRSFILAVNNQGPIPVAKKLYVTAGKSYEGDIVVEEGLTEDVQVIIKGARSVSEGDYLEIQQTEEQDGPKE
jgi:membrane fusion protein, multidrug efflux system